MWLTDLWCDCIYSVQRGQGGILLRAFVKTAMDICVFLSRELKSYVAINFTRSILTIEIIMQHVTTQLRECAW
jgi:hypothetical protein